MSDEEEVLEKITKKRRKLIKKQFIDDEAELSGDDEISDDEADGSDQDDIDLDLVDKDAPELDSDEEEEVRGFYHKQLESDDKRALLLLQEQLEDKDVSIGQRRRRKFRWQTKELMDNALGRHYDPDEDDSQEFDDDDDDDDDDYDESKPRIRRPTAETVLIGSTKITSRRTDFNSTNPLPSKPQNFEPVAGPSGFSDDSNSNTLINRLASTATKNTGPSDLSRFVFRDREIVEALSTKETIIITREEKNQLVQREIKRVLQSKSIFDQLYS